NCHYAPTITRGVVSVSRLVNKGFSHCFTDYELLVSIKNIIYFNAITVNVVYEIDMRDFTLPIVNSRYSISNKKAKSSLDSSYLWHCRLAHIDKKRITKLQKDGILKSTDNEPYDKCESCISGKMTKKPFSHKTEKVNDVLGLIHTDVCGPLRHVSKKSVSYFITFTDDYSRYGYVYLLKHKHEVFETFKVFKNEVENQLGKTIKALRSDRGGEYISQEFKDYLKACGIVQQLTPPYTPQHNGVSERRNHTLLNMVRSMMSLTTLHLSFWDYALETAARILNMVPTKKQLTPPYTPQHNGVSERRNRTLLNMVRSMMSLTTLPLSFWDYALETAARILNMVPTKKVDKTPYELWHGKVPNLSYLKGWGCEAHVKRHTTDKLEQRFVKSARTPKAPNRLCLNVEIFPDQLYFNVEVEEHSLGD
nr:retrotransposon protein, putative, Ty1-copia subclass [Tanacetum cinerariifolium]